MPEVPVPEASVPVLIAEIVKLADPSLSLSVWVEELVSIKSPVDSPVVPELAKFQTL